MKHFVFIVLLIFLFTTTSSKVYTMQQEISRNENITVIELRNYLLRPKTSERFQKLFNDRFVDPINDLGGYVVGQFSLEGESDRFVWMRGFQSMQTRFKFLNDFYLNSDVWKKYRNEANGMIINSDNVYLLRPLAENGDLNETGASIHRSALQKNNGLVIIDFYVCNGRLEQTIELFKNKYLPYLETLGISKTTLWVSEMTENDFPRLPAFQDRNLLVTMTTFRSGSEYQSKMLKFDSPDQGLKNEMLELVTTHNRWVLHAVN
jgi:hypothetical protein